MKRSNPNKKKRPSHKETYVRLAQEKQEKQKQKEEEWLANEKRLAAGEMSERSYITHTQDEMFLKNAPQIWTDYLKFLEHEKNANDQFTSKQKVADLLKIFQPFMESIREYKPFRQLHWLNGLFDILYNYENTRNSTVMDRDTRNFLDSIDNGNLSRNIVAAWREGEKSRHVMQDYTILNVTPTSWSTKIYFPRNIEVRRLLQTSLRYIYEGQYFDTVDQYDFTKQVSLLKQIINKLFEPQIIGFSINSYLDPKVIDQSKKLSGDEQRKQQIYQEQISDLQQDNKVLNEQMSEMEKYHEYLDKEIIMKDFIIKSQTNKSKVTKDQLQKTLLEITDLKNEKSLLEDTITELEKQNKQKLLAIQLQIMNSKISKAQIAKMILDIQDLQKQTEIRDNKILTLKNDSIAKDLKIQNLQDSAIQEELKMEALQEQNKLNNLVINQQNIDSKASQAEIKRNTLEIQELKKQAEIRLLEIQELKEQTEIRDLQIQTLQDQTTLNGLLLTKSQNQSLLEQQQIKFLSDTINLRDTQLNDLSRKAAQTELQLQQKLDQYIIQLNSKDAEIAKLLTPPVMYDATTGIGDFSLNQSQTDPITTIEQATQSRNTTSIYQQSESILMTDQQQQVLPYHLRNQYNNGIQTDPTIMADQQQQVLPYSLQLPIDLATGIPNIKILPQQLPTFSVQFTQGVQTESMVKNTNKSQQMSPKQSFAVPPLIKQKSITFENDPDIIKSKSLPMALVREKSNPLPNPDQYRIELGQIELDIKELKRANDQNKKNLAEATDPNIITWLQQRIQRTDETIKKNETKAESIKNLIPVAPIKPVEPKAPKAPKAPVEPVDHIDKPEITKIMKYLYNNTKDADKKAEIANDRNTLTDEQLYAKYGKYDKVYHEYKEHQESEAGMLKSLRAQFLQGQVVRKQSKKTKRR